MKRVILTGSTGYLGSHLIDYDVFREAEFYCILNSSKSADMMRSSVTNSKLGSNFHQYIDSGSLIEWLNGINPDTLLHFASAVIPEHSNNDIHRLIQSNIEFGTNVLDAFKVIGISPDVINIGTGWQHYNGDKYNPVCLYAATKQAFEDILYYYAVSEKFKCINLHFFDIYGPEDRRSKLIPYLLNNKFSFDIALSPGEQILELLHVYDVCQGIKTALDLLGARSPGYYDTFALPSLDRFSVKEIVSILNANGAQLKPDFGARAYRKREVMNPRTPLKPLPGWKQIHRFKDFVVHQLAEG